MFPRTPLRALAAGVVGFACAFTAAVAPARAATPTDVFDEALAVGIDAPSNSTFLADGRFLVVGQYTAQLTLYVPAPAGVFTVGTIPNVRSDGEAGLLGVAVDPGFPARPYVYVHATHTPPNEIRITRYTLQGDLAYAGNGAMTIDPASARVVLGAVPDLNSKHNGGSLRFGNDGKLFVALGDDDVPCDALRRGVLRGKILRLDVSTLPAGGGAAPRYATITPADNPFVADPDSVARLVYAMGFRNPFSFTVDPGSGCLVVGDVGNTQHEEIDVVCAGGGKYGWPIFEGPARVAITCTGADTTGLIAPSYSYPQVGLGWAVFAGPIYRAPAGAEEPFPLSYEGNLFFGDTWKGWVRRLEPSGPNWVPASAAPGQPNATDWADGRRYITSMHVGPKDGSIWYTLLYRTVPSSGPGEIRRYRWLGPAVDVDESPVTAGGLAFVRVTPVPARAGAPIELSWRQDAPAPVSLRIVDVTGRVVRALVAPAEGLRAAGPHRVTWDGTRTDGARAAAGVYVATLEAGGVRRAIRLVRL